MGQLSLQPVEGLGLSPLFVTPDQVTDVLADILIGPVIAYVGRHEVTQGSTKADGHRGCSGHGAAPLSFGVFNITKKAHKTSCRSPGFAAVNGICCGGGLELALSCDLILASDTATFALPEIRSGTVADAASIKLPKRIPYHVAMDLLLTGRWFDAHEAMHWGLLREITTPADLLPKAWALARMLENGPPLVYAAIKEIVREAEAMRFQDALNRVTKRQFATVDQLYASDDQKEGARAFAQKRDPVWTGR